MLVTGAKCFTQFQFTSKSSMRFVCLIFTAGWVSCGWATQYLVSPNGKPSGAGTVADPLASIAAAVARADQPGDVVMVAGGVYHNERIRFVASGTADQPITLQAAPGEVVILKGTLPIEESQWRPHDGKIVQTDWRFAFGGWDDRFLDGDPGNDPTHRGNKPRNRVFIDGSRVLEEVGNVDAMSDGTFCIDGDADTLYLWPPSESGPTPTIEVTSQSSHLIATGGHDHLVIRGMTLRRVG